MKTERDYSEEELIEGIRSHSQPVFEYLYQQVAPLIYNDIIKKSGSKQDAEDHFHDVMLVVTQNIKNDKYKQGNMIGYIRMVARNLWHKRLRKKNNELSYEEQANIDPADEANFERYSQLVQYDKEIELLKKKLEALGDTCKEILQAFYYRQVTLNEIADKFDWTYAYCKKKIYECRKKLKDSVEDDLSLGYRNSG